MTKLQQDDEDAFRRQFSRYIKNGITAESVSSWFKLTFDHILISSCLLICCTFRQRRLRIHSWHVLLIFFFYCSNLIDRSFILAVWSYQKLWTQDVSVPQGMHKTLRVWIQCHSVLRYFGDRDISTHELTAVIGYVKSVHCPVWILWVRSFCTVPLCGPTVWVVFCVCNRDRKSF